MLKLPDSQAPFPDSFSPTRLSAAIGLARVICILGVIYVHAWTGLDGARLAQASGTGQGILRWTLVELLGRSAVPLLGMISGWLVAGPAWSRPYGSFIGGKARTILLPMLLWNMLAMLIISGGAALGLLRAPVPGSLWIAVNQLFCLVSANETNVQMAFLRDLFVCMVMAPLLVRLRSRTLWAVAAATALWAVSGLSVPLLLRPPILLFFIAGILARRTRLELRVTQVPVAQAALIFGICALGKLWLSSMPLPGGEAHPQVMAAFDLMLRFAAALFVWRLAWQLAGSQRSSLLLRIEPYAFFIFCSHLFFMWLAGPAIGTLTGPLGSPLYPAFLLLQPAMAALVAIALGRVLMTIAPGAAKLLSGGRLKGKAEASAQAARLIPGA